MAEIEKHPLGFFLPPNTKLLMLGSFPPPKKRWSMEFYYPNIQNDMWRIMGLLFYRDIKHFLLSPKSFNSEAIKQFCIDQGIGLGDTAMEVIRLRNNASDNFLEVVIPIDIHAVLQTIPFCKTIVITGQKAMDTLLSVLPKVQEPKVGSFVSFTVDNRLLRLYRMPSSSRAYPKPIEEKAAFYKTMFEENGFQTLQK